MALAWSIKYVPSPTSSLFTKVNKEEAPRGAGYVVNGGSWCQTVMAETENRTCSGIHVRSYCVQGEWWSGECQTYRLTSFNPRPQPSLPSLGVRDRKLDRAWEWGHRLAYIYIVEQVTTWDLRLIYYHENWMLRTHTHSGHCIKILGYGKRSVLDQNWIKWSKPFIREGSK